MCVCIAVVFFAGVTLAPGFQGAHAIPDVQDLFGSDCMDATKMVPSCYDRNHFKLKKKLLEGNAPIFRDLPPACQLAILISTHNAIVKVSKTSEKVLWKHGWDGLKLLHQYNYWPKSRSFALAEQLQAQGHGQPSHAGNVETPANDSAGTTEFEEYVIGVCTKPVSVAVYLGLRNTLEVASACRSMGHSWRSIHPDEWHE